MSENRGGGRIEEALRSKPSKKELDAQRIEIECVEPPGGGNDGYIVTVYPKRKQSKKNGIAYEEPIKRVFESEDATLEFLKKVL